MLESWKLVHCTTNFEFSVVHGFICIGIVALRRRQPSAAIGTDKMVSKSVDVPSTRFLLLMYARVR